ncbi:MAG: hypothetical protein QJR03_13625 [Sphaerobacter sp.]|nr:hypothetical protein [Sphaerobacter sp.]
MSGMSQPPRTGPARRSRVLASLAYAGPLSLGIVALLPRSPFLMRHALVALTLHLVRFAWGGLFLVLWRVPEPGAGVGRAARLAVDLAMLLLVGLPWPSGLTRDTALLLSLPLGATWVLGLAGALAAATGRTFDLDALLHADWPDDAPPPPVVPAAHVDERAQARALRERRLARIWQASLVARSEQRRRERMEQLKEQMDAVLIRLDYLNHLLSLGELSLNRFTAMHTELIRYLDALRRELAELQSRWADVPPATQWPVPPPALTELPPVRVLTLAVLDHGGVPIFTSGHFPLDESLVTGMVSAIDSLSEEMFGSRVLKTQLAEGQVVHFARGRYTVAFALFEDEPAPVQIGHLRDFLHAFEQANAAALTASPVDTSRLTPVPVPFAFLQPPPGDPLAPAAPARLPAAGAGGVPGGG